MGLSRVSIMSGSARTRQWCDWLAQSKMGHDVGPVQEGETRQGKKSRLTMGNWPQRAKGI
jgi:hypothetical protein